MSSRYRLCKGALYQHGSSEERPYKLCGFPKDCPHSVLHPHSDCYRADAYADGACCCEPVDVPAKRKRRHV